MTNNQSERYKTIIDYFADNKERLAVEGNQDYLTRVYANLLHKHKLEKINEYKELADKLYVLVEGPNYLLGHWEELGKLEANN